MATRYSVLVPSPQATMSVGVAVRTEAQVSAPAAAGDELGDLRRGLGDVRGRGLEKEGQGGLVGDVGDDVLAGGHPIRLARVVGDRESAAAPIVPADDA